MRTYVAAGDRPGVWFFSLDTTSALAVEVGRRVLRAPFFGAEIAVHAEDDWTSLSCTRAAESRPFVFDARFRAAAAAAAARPGTLEHFLSERYCLYALDGSGELRRAEVHHRPWSLRPAEVDVDLNTMVPDGIELPGGPPLAWYSEAQDLLLWSPRAVEANDASAAPV